jgi:hypothetical protein
MKVITESWAQVPGKTSIPYYCLILRTRKAQLYVVISLRPALFQRDLTLKTEIRNYLFLQGILHHMLILFHMHPVGTSWQVNVYRIVLSFVSNLDNSISHIVTFLFPHLPTSSQASWQLNSILAVQVQYQLRTAWKKWCTQGNMPSLPFGISNSQCPWIPRPWRRGFKVTPTDSGKGVCGLHGTVGR